MKTKVRVYRNTAPNAPHWKVGHLPIRQTLIWVGPIFILIQRNRWWNDQP